MEWPLGWRAASLNGMNYPLLSTPAGTKKYRQDEKCLMIEVIVPVATGILSARP
jgi:hypothetical protein